MQIDVDVRQPAQPTTRSVEPWQPWILGPIAIDRGQWATPGARTYSFLAECECPDDCLRDHENE